MMVQRVTSPAESGGGRRLSGGSAALISRGPFPESADHLYSGRYRVRPLPEGEVTAEFTIINLRRIAAQLPLERVRAGIEVRTTSSNLPEISQC